MLYVDPYHKQLYQLGMKGGGRTQGIPVQPMSHPTSVDYDPSGGRVYWLDAEARVIKGSKLDGDDDAVLLRVTDGMGPAQKAPAPNIL